VISARLDHDATHIFDIRSSGLWSLAFSDEGRADLMDEAMRTAQAAVLAAARHADVIGHARLRAETLICAFFADALGWSVEIRWLDRDERIATDDARPRLPTRVVGAGRVASSLHIRPLRNCV